MEQPALLTAAVQNKSRTALVASSQAVVDGMGDHPRRRLTVACYFQSRSLVIQWSWSTKCLRRAYSVSGGSRKPSYYL
jgi:hypothetical protein